MYTIRMIAAATTVRSSYGMANCSLETIRTWSQPRNMVLF